MLINANLFQKRKYFTKYSTTQTLAERIKKKKLTEK